MGEFRLPSGAWGTDIFPDWKMKIIDDNFTITPVGTDPTTRNEETLFSIQHTGNISCHYSLNIGESINVNGQSDVAAYFGGNLGICNMNPTHTLDVLGDINATGYIGNGALITNITFSSGKWYGDTDIHYPTNISIGSIIANATLDVNGTIYGGYDNNTTSFFGKTAIGSLDTDIATMSHLYHNTLTNFAIQQTDTGKTLLNSNTSLLLKIDDLEKISITNNNIIINSNLQINGSLTIKGDNTNLNSYNIRIDDPIFSLNTNSTGNNLYDSGILIDRGNELNVAIIWDESDDMYSFVDTPDIDVKGDLLINDYIPLKIDVLHANGSEDPSYFLGNVLINGSISTYNVDVFGKINANSFLVNGTPLNISSSSSSPNIETVNIYDLKSTGTPGGTFTYGVWQIRDLNTISSHITSGSVTLSSNQFTISAGTYFIKVRAPAYNVNHHKCRLYNVTDSIIHAAGTNATGYNSATSPVSFSLLESDIIVVSNKTYRIEHWGATTRTNDGYGSAMGQSNIDEIYTSIVLYKIT
jgi:hypothetical protein